MDDVDAWAKEQLRIMNEEEAATNHKVLIPLSTDKFTQHYAFHEAKIKPES